MGGARRGEAERPGGREARSPMLTATLGSVLQQLAHLPQQRCWGICSIRQRRTSVSRTVSAGPKKWPRRLQALFDFLFL